MTLWTGPIRHFENTPGKLTGKEIPLFQFQETDISKLLIDGTNPDELLTKEQAIFLLEQMYTIREFEEAFAQLVKPAKDRNERFQQFSDTRYRGAAHLYKGEEAVAAPISLALKAGDYISSTHRGHGHAIGIRIPLDQMVAEMLGKYDSCCKGKGGSMHITGIGETGIISLGANGVVGGGYGIAVGAARELQIENKENIVFSFVGDGSTATGSSHEAMTLAKTYNAPIAFMIEDNGAGMTGRVDEVFGFKKSYEIARRALAYNIPGEVVNGMDVLAVLDAFKRAGNELRKGEGPRLFVFTTYRYFGHSLSDIKDSYTTKEENAEWEAQDAIKQLENKIISTNILTRDGIDKLKAGIQQKIDDTIRECSKRPVPPIETLTQDVYADSYDDKIKSITVLIKHRETDTRTFEFDGYRLAIFETLKQLMETDNRVVLFGEDVRNYGGPFSVTCVNRKTGPFLADMFGPDRLWNTPIAEEAIVASAIGMGIVGGRPIAEVMYSDFLRQAANAIHLQGKNIRYMFGGQFKVRATIRFPTGGGRGYACQHGSEVLSEINTSPGVRVVIPSNPFDAKGLLVTAVYSDDLVLFGEHQLLYNIPKFIWGNEVPKELYSIPFGKANIIREGKDLTIWAYSAMVDVALRAARDLAREDSIECEVIDPRTLNPLDMETVYRSVEKTGNLLCVSQGTYTGNFCHTIVSNALQMLGSGIAAKVIAAPDCPPPTAENLENAYLPNSQLVVDTILKWDAEPGMLVKGR